MRLVRFERKPGAEPEIGVVVADRIHPAPPGWQFGMGAIIARWSDLHAQLGRWPEQSSPIKLHGVRLLAPNPSPSKVLAIGFNYKEHAAEAGIELPQKQIWFTKLANSINGPFDPILIPAASTSVDYEVELVAVIGRRTRNVKRRDACKFVFGYCVGNDVSMRDWQFRTSQYLLGKSGDSHTPFGPWITTADEVADPHVLGIKAYVNGELRQSSNTRYMIFDLFEQISELSQVMTLEPGDLIFTGTPSGVGFARKPPLFLAPGDVVRCEIENLGYIEGKMQAEPASAQT